MPTGPRDTNKLTTLVESAIRIYKIAEPFLDAAGKVQGGADAWAKGWRALATRELSANDPTIEEARVKCKALVATLAGLAREDENYWFDRSGVNPHDALQTQHARHWLQQRQRDFADAQRMVEGQLPLVVGLKDALKCPAGLMVRAAMEPTSLHFLDVFALEEIVRNLNGRADSLKQIQRRLQTAAQYLVR